MQPKLTLHLDPVPLVLEEDGTARVGTSRVTLDLVIEEFEEGNSPEGIVEGYDTLKLADVFAVIAYYLRHKEEVAAYLAQRDREAEKLWQEIQASQPPPPTREELLARRARMEAGNAPVANR